MFDWREFCEQQGVEYVTTGPNVTRGHIAVRCPFCGAADPSHHMSISESGAGWRCWRNHDHKGKSPIKLIQALTGCTYEHAKHLIGDTTHIPENFMDQVLVHLRPPAPPAQRVLKELKEFKLLNRQLPSFRLFKQHLKARGFSDLDIDSMSGRYDMRYCTSGAFKGRIIFLVKHNNKLVSWTGRTVYSSALFRYKSLTTDPVKAAWDGGGQPAIGPINHYLLWYDKLKVIDADTIYLTEGPMDCLKMMVLGRNHGICSTCFFTSEPTVPQIDLLHELLPRFKHRYLLLDQGTLPTMLRVAAKLTGLGISIRQLPKNVKDPGALDWKQFADLCCL